MEKWHVVVLLLMGFGLLVIAVLARARYGDKYELKTIDLVLIIIPLLFALLIGGKLQTQKLAETIMKHDGTSFLTI